MPAIRLEHVAKIYSNSSKGVSGTLFADLRIRQGEFVCITGEQGCGKSTLMEIIAGEQEPDRGTIWLGAADLGRMNGWQKNELRRCMGIVLENAKLKRTETVFKNLASERRLEYLRDKLVNRPKMEKALSLVGMRESAERRASELTDSECCRVLLARAIWRSPYILVLDGLLDRAEGDAVWDMLHLLTALNDRGTTVILATGKSYGTMLGKRVVRLVDGKIASDTQRG